MGGQAASTEAIWVVKYEQLYTTLFLSRPGLRGLQLAMYRRGLPEYMFNSEALNPGFQRYFKKHISRQEVFIQFKFATFIKRFAHFADSGIPYSWSLHQYCKELGSNEDYLKKKVEELLSMKKVPKKLLQKAKCIYFTLRLKHTHEAYSYLGKKLDFEVKSLEFFFKLDPDAQKRYKDHQLVVAISASAYKSQENREFVQKFHDEFGFHSNNTYLPHEFLIPWIPDNDIFEWYFKVKDTDPLKFEQLKKRMNLILKQIDFSNIIKELEMKPIVNTKKEFSQKKKKKKKKKS